MKRDDILEKVKTTIVEEFDISKDCIFLETSLDDDLYIDFVDEIVLVAKLEERFNIAMQDAGEEVMCTVESIVDYVEAQLL